MTNEKVEILCTVCSVGPDKINQKYTIIFMSPPVRRRHETLVERKALAYCLSQ